MTAQLGKTISIIQAAKITGMSSQVLSRYARTGVFAACQPAGRRGGWRIIERDFMLWWLLRCSKTGNAACRRAAEKELNQLALSND